jgi:hypothetical protein
VGGAAATGWCRAGGGASTHSGTLQGWHQVIGEEGWGRVEVVIEGACTAGGAAATGWCRAGGGAPHALRHHRGWHQVIGEEG